MSDYVFCAGVGGYYYIKYIRTYDVVPDLEIECAHDIWIITQVFFHFILFNLIPYYYHAHAIPLLRQYVNEILTQSEVSKLTATYDNAWKELDACYINLCYHITYNVSYVL